MISPEGCAGILWKSGEHAEKAATALKFTSKYLKEFGVVDDIIPEPLGGAHRDDKGAADTLGDAIWHHLGELMEKPYDTLIEERYEKFRLIGSLEEKS